MSRSQSLAVGLLLFALGSSSVSSSATPERRTASSSSSLQYGACFNVKEYDDDSADDDGNSYFYNGAYRAAYSRYASFFLCTGGNTNGKSLLDDGNCSGPYVTDLGTYMQVLAAFAVNYCDQCKSCRRRSLDEAEQQQSVVANCNSCKTECSALWKDSSSYKYSQGGDNNNEDDDPFACQAAADGSAYYSGPQCIAGEIALGAFYDDECKFKTSAVFDASSATFTTIESMAVDCTANADVCEQLQGQAFSCASDNSNNGNNNDNYSASICKAAKTSLRTRTYYKKPRKRHGGALLFMALSATLFVTLSYAYYVRHSQKRVPLALQDGKADYDTDPSNSSPEKPKQHQTSSDLPAFT
jgi:hypothetical protein